MRKQYVRFLGLHVICAVAMLTAADSAWSSLNKCTGTDGKVTYTEQPCEQNQTRTTVKISSTRPSEDQGSYPRNNLASPGQVAQCEQARKILQIAKNEVADERHKNKHDVLASAKQTIANLERLIREQCN